MGFRLSWPVEGAPVEPPTQNFRESQTDHTVLVVDTDKSVVDGYAQSLRRAGYAVLQATSFEEAKGLWRATMPAVLVVDVRLGQYNGLQLLMRARTDRPNLKAIITCPFADHVLEAETRRFGGTFMIKPLAPWQIAAAVITAVASDQRVPNTPPVLVERRRMDRRAPDGAYHGPERRKAERRASARLSAERRLDDRRKLVVPDFAPDRRLSDRRTPRRP